MIISNSGWQGVLSEEWQKPYYQAMWQTLDTAYSLRPIYPPKSQVFQAFELVDYDQVKVVILGQDPYHGEGQAHGLSFSVQKGVKLPPSLRNIFKELESDMGIVPPEHGCLTEWVKQGVLMFNAVLTVEAGQAGSHKKIGWHTFTDQVIKALNEREQGIVFVLWGNFAISKKKFITGQQHRIIESVHPSPLSARRGFFGSRPFSQVNRALESMGVLPVDWSL